MLKYIYDKIQLYPNIHFQLGGKIKSWHKRYFVLKTGVLSYWKSQVKTEKIEIASKKSRPAESYTILSSYIVYDTEMLIDNAPLVFFPLKVKL